MVYTYHVQENCPFFAMEEITAEDVKSIMKDFSSGVVKSPKVGKLSITNCFVPKIKEKAPELLAQEGSYVFYAIDKLSTGFFSKASRRILIWIPVSDMIFAVPVEAVSFEKPEQGAKQEFFIKREGEEEALCKTNCYDREHICFFEKMELYREFAIEEKVIEATKDILYQHFRWTNPDAWVREHFKIRDDYDPMYFLRNTMAQRKIPGWSVRISYPTRPALWGYHIEE